MPKVKFKYYSLFFVGFLSSVLHASSYDSFEAMIPLGFIMGGLPAAPSEEEPQDYEGDILEDPEVLGAMVHPGFIMGGGLPAPSGPQDPEVRRLAGYEEEGDIWNAYRILEEDKKRLVSSESFYGRNDLTQSDFANPEKLSQIKNFLLYQLLKSQEEGVFLSMIENDLLDLAFKNSDFKNLDRKLIDIVYFSAITKFLGAGECLELSSHLLFELMRAQIENIHSYKITSINGSSHVFHQFVVFEVSKKKYVLDPYFGLFLKYEDYLKNETLLKSFKQFTSDPSWNPNKKNVKIESHSLANYNYKEHLSTLEQLHKFFLDRFYPNFELITLQKRIQNVIQATSLKDLNCELNRFREIDQPSRSEVKVTPELIKNLLGNASMIALKSRTALNWGYDKKKRLYFTMLSPSSEKQARSLLKYLAPLKGSVSRTKQGGQWCLTISSDSTEILKKLMDQFGAS